MIHPLRARFLVTSVLVAASLAASCGGSVVTGGTGTGGTGATTSGSGAGTTAPTGCPMSQPSGSCAGVQPGLRCSYGDSVRPECRSAVTCLNGQWLAGNNSGACVQPPSGACPAAPSPGQVCTSQSAVCSYMDTLCLCDECAAGPCMAPPVTWQCAPPPSTPGCPATVPNDGTPCSAPGTMCTYGYPCTSTGAVVQCAGGAWTWNTMIACAG